MFLGLLLKGQNQVRFSLFLSPLTEDNRVKRKEAFKYPKAGSKSILTLCINFLRFSILQPFIYVSFKIFPRAVFLKYSVRLFLARVQFARSEQEEQSSHS